MSDSRIGRQRELTQELERGFVAVRDSERFKHYLSTIARFHDYSMCNCLLIWAQRPDATRVAGFQTWRGMGRYVKRGEKGIRIMAPMPWRRVEDVDGEEEVTAEGCSFKAVSVFDLSQTDGEGLPTIADDLAGDDAGLFDRLAVLATTEGLSIDRTPGRGNGSNGFYARDRKLIWLRPDTAPVMAAKTLAHELSHHYAGHVEGQCRGEMETVAEGAAYVVLGHFNIDAGSYTFDYLASWTDDKVFKAKLAEIHGAATTIIDAVERAA